MSRALVTGAGGFVGANLVRRLLGEGVRVIAFVRPEGDPWRLDEVVRDVELVEVDLRDDAALRSAVSGSRPERVFHLAAHGAYSWQTDAERIVATNLLSTMALLDATREAHSVVLAGSSSEYGFKDHPPSEDEPPEPNSPYAVAKVAATMWGRHVARAQDRHVVTLRLYSAYGPWEEPDRLVPQLVVRALRGELPPLVGPDTARDFVHVDDVCAAFVAAAAATDSPRGAVYNIGAGRQVTLRDLVDVARDVLGIEVEPEWGSMPGRRWDTSIWVADPRRIERELGWRATVALDDGLRTMRDWLEAGAPAIRERYRAAGGR
jgi:dolichol-phosphate mannosyltransferase